MPDVETKVSTVSSAYQGRPDPGGRGRGADGARTGHGRWSDERFKLLPDGSKTEVQNKKTVKERSKLLQCHLRSNFWGQIFGVKFLGSNFWNQIFGVKFFGSNFSAQIFGVKFLDLGTSRAFTDFKKISIFISEFGFYIFTEDGFQISASLLIGWEIFEILISVIFAWTGFAVHKKSKHAKDNFNSSSNFCPPIHPPTTLHLWLINYESLSKNWIWKVGNNNDVFQNSLFNFWRTFRNYFLFMIVTPLTTYPRILHP